MRKFEIAFWMFIILFCGCSKPEDPQNLKGDVHVIKPKPINFLSKDEQKFKFASNFRLVADSGNDLSKDLEILKSLNDAVLAKSDPESQNRWKAYLDNQAQSLYTLYRDKKLDALEQKRNVFLEIAKDIENQ